MGYSITDDVPAPANPRHQLKLSTGTPLDAVHQMLISLHGPEATVEMNRYCHHIRSGLLLLTQIEGLGDAATDPQAKPLTYADLEEEIRAAADNFHQAADAMASLEGSTVSPANLLQLIPMRVLARLVRKGLECEGDDLLDLIECTCPPAGTIPDPA